MTLASSGYIRMGGTDANRSVNVELGRSSTAVITFTESAVRTLTGIASGPVTLPSSFWGKPSAPVVNIDALAGTWISYYSIILPVTIDLLFANDGVLQMFSDNTEDLLFNGGAASTWATPTGSGVGNNFWINWTRVGTTGTNGSATASSAGRLALSTTRTIAVYKSAGGTTDYTAEYDFEIWDAASGGTRVGYAPGVTIIASRATGP
jgi:hypothetical protein